MARRTKAEAAAARLAQAEAARERARTALRAADWRYGLLARDWLQDCGWIYVYTTGAASGLFRAPRSRKVLTLHAAIREQRRRDRRAAARASRG